MVVSKAGRVRMRGVYVYLNADTFECCRRMRNPRATFFLPLIFLRSLIMRSVRL